MKKILEVINRKLKENDQIIDFFSKIVFGIVTISIAINANQIADLQKKIDEISVLPNISIEIDKEDDTTPIEIISDGAPVYNVEIESETLISFMVRKPAKLISKTYNKLGEITKEKYKSEIGTLDLRIDDYYFPARKTGNHVGTLAKIPCNDIRHNFKEFRDELERITKEEYATFSCRLTTYVEISYTDYLDRKYEEIFKISKYISASKIKEKYGDGISEKDLKNKEKIQLNSGYYDYVLQQLKDIEYI